MVASACQSPKRVQHSGASLILKRFQNDDKINPDSFESPRRAQRSGASLWRSSKSSFLVMLCFVKAPPCSFKTFFFSLKVLSLLVSIVLSGSMLSRFKGSLGLHVGSFFLSFSTTFWRRLGSTFWTILILSWAYVGRLFHFFRSQNEVLLQGRFNIDFCSIL